MKTKSIFRLTLSGFIAWLTVSLSSCLFDKGEVSLSTLVYPDGRLEKIFLYEHNDSSNQKMHKFLLDEDLKSWKITTQQKIIYHSKTKSDSIKDTVYVMTFSKKFQSADEANRELATENDTLFRVTSHFEKKFRWFFTYIKYSDTYHPLWGEPLEYNPFDKADYEFIEKLPAKDKDISTEDSAHVKRIHDEWDEYLENISYKILGEVFVNALASSNILENRWIDSLQRHTVTLGEKLRADFENFDRTFDSLGIPLKVNMLPAQFEEDYEFHLHEATIKFEYLVNNLLKFAAYDFNHCIQMPGTLVSTNADSIAGTELYWKPYTEKFILTYYTMFAETRLTNYWAIAVTVAIVILILYISVNKTL